MKKASSTTKTVTRAASLRRHFIIAGAALSAASASAAESKVAAPTAREIRQASGPTDGFDVRSVRFKNGAIQMAGNLYVPKGFDPSRKYAAVVVLHPAGGVKEQTAGLYAQRLASQGFVTLAYDASHQGESGGEPRFLESPEARVADTRSAVDFLTTLGYVDRNRIGALGICAGSGYAVKATMLDRRIKAIATVSAFDIGTGFRKGWVGNVPLAEQLATLEKVSAQRTAEAGGGEPIYVNYVPETVDASTHRDMREAHAYYRTPAGHMHPNSQNKMLFTSLDKIYAFTGFDQVETLLTQPLLVVAGSEAGSLWHSRDLFAKKKGDKELFVIKGATHMDLYAGEHVDQALQKLTPFYKQKL
ncbi:hypothetical protein SAMN05444354_13185 [Stigmatella aurantiaca]|uniref:Dienelactone hydrolase domain-containing protein n=1 Tax=Stigmatella aurantiaca TaxID=41 RepID=A0A1H8E2Q5_STIAU|nr:alpha/beta hydrolase [Stigmatella aurantiaca]SEN13715.1 hypothetical protein SAMN05444354_13185 [Stigmatella aurantiaca]